MLRQIDALGHRLHDFIEQVHDLGPLALQFLDDFHARDQPLLAVLEILDVGNLRVELDDFIPQQSVLLVLGVGPARVQELAAQGEDHGGEYRAARCDHELATSDFAFLFAPGK